MPYLVVSPLSRLHETALTEGASHMVTLINVGTPVTRPPSIAPERHLFLGLSDITAPMDGHVMPGAEHVARFIAFAREWEQARPLLIHCWAGVSRSTAAAFIAACALNPHRDEMETAQALRAASPSATPNARLVAVADEMLGRQGRMVAAVAAIGRGADAFEGAPFRLEIS
jgi:predicted protein tyrosine phosphatase